MKAVAYHEYGSPDVLRHVTVDVPVPGPRDVLVRVRAAALNPFDWRLMRADPFLVRSRMGWLRLKAETIIGSDMAGIVESVGVEVTRFQPGDEVFAQVETGALAEYIAFPEALLAAKPKSSTFEQAAAVPVAGVTALQGLRDYGRIQAGHRVLVNGASGGIGSFAVQLAKVFGAHVTGVCSARNVELVGSIGADRVIDYSGEDFTESGGQYDLVFDTVGNRPIREFLRALTPKGTFALVGGGKGKVLGPAAQMLAASLVNPFVSQRVAPVSDGPNSADLETLAQLIDAGKVTPVIDRVFTFEQSVDAIRFVEKGHARGKTVVSVAG